MEHAEQILDLAFDADARGRLLAVLTGPADGAAFGDVIAAELAVRGIALPLPTSWPRKIAALKAAVMVMRALHGTPAADRVLQIGLDAAEEALS